MVSVPVVKDRGADNEKVSINLGYVDLGRIDLLVREGFYSNRSDLIRTAIRKELDGHRTALDSTIERHTMELGLRDYTRNELEALKASGEMLHVKVVGLARIDEDVSPDLAVQTIGSITVLGALQASAAVKMALADRIY